MNVFGANTAPQTSVMLAIAAVLLPSLLSPGWSGNGAKPPPQIDDRVGARHFVDPAKIPPPSKSIISIPKIIRGKGLPPLRVPSGFKIDVFAEDVVLPRNMAVAPNGDVFVVEANSQRVAVLRDSDGDGRAETRRLFCVGLRGPHGIAFYKGYVYIANTGSVVRFPYKDGQTKAEGQPEIVVPDLPAKPGYNMHWTRSIAFAPTDGRMYVSIGSATNDDVEPFPRGTIQSYLPDGSDRRLFASGLRNAVGLTFRPGTGELWASCIERDFMGGDTPPDFITRVRLGQFFGWPYYYIGKNRDPRHKTKTPPRIDVAIPTICVEAHSIPLSLAFYSGTMFPSEYWGDMFVAMRGSTNRVPRSGYKVVRVKFRGGLADPSYEDFVVGWVPDRRRKEVWGRPSSLAIARDGALLIADESAHRIWRVSHAVSPTNQAKKEEPKAPRFRQVLQKASPFRD